MINFRYHIISIVAVFLALAIGVLMGSAVIDRVLVETLTDQQAAIDDRVDEVLAANSELRTSLADLEARSRQLADEGSERLLAGSLADVPVLVLAVRGVESEGLDDLVALLGTAGADYQGTLWFTGRLALADEEQRRDLARALGLNESLPAGVLRARAIARIVDALTIPAGEVGVGADGQPTEGESGAVTGEDGAVTDGVPVEGDDGAVSDDQAVDDAAVPASSTTLADLREAGFVDFEPPEGEPEKTVGLAVPGTRVVLVSGPTATLDDATWARPLAEALVGGEGADADVPLLAVEAFAAGDPQRAEFTEPLRTDDMLSVRLSTVNNIDDFAGRLAAVLAVQDLASGRVGHYGRGAPRLIPAPAE